MKKIIAFIIAFLIFATASAVSAATVQHKVIKGESMWIISVKYKVGLQEIIAANPQVKNPNLIYPGQILNVPLVPQEVTSFEQHVISLTNQQRSKYGLKPLTHNWELSRVARIKSQDMHDRNYFSHNSPTYGSPFTMIKNFGISYRTAGENIAKGYATPQAVVNGWMNSSGHRANILNASFTQIGVGYYASGHYWTQMFIG
ncbi:MAG TPA: SafA/ExsA family spore coat assembly protein [Clostridiales bacterium]|nr:SafA/ExsA family spore coat assembly protein [Clostridiales bacterium]